MRSRWRKKPASQPKSCCDSKLTNGYSKTAATCFNTAARSGYFFFARFFGASMVPVHDGAPQRHSNSFFTAAVWRSS
jgi:hypothetical protein